MLYLGLAILSSAAISVLMRLADKYIKNNMIMFAANYAACGLLSLIFLAVDGEGARIFGAVNGLSGLTFSVTLGIISGVLYLLSFMLLQYNIQRNGVVLAATFMKLGVLVPILMSVVLGWDKPTVLQVAGCILAVTAIIIINGEGKVEKKTSFAGSLLIILLLIGGFTDSLSNIYDKLGNPELKNLYLLFIFISAVIVSIVLAGFKKQKFVMIDAFWGVLIGIPNYFSARFLLYALGKVPAIVAYPVYNITVILIVSILGFLLFKEKCSKRKLTGISIILLAILLLNL